jgi:phosphatidylserine/phosphatidylglycerophosphate/cardiolipin synthase-like enzyme
MKVLTPILTDIEVVPNAATAREIYLNLISNASEEILLIFPTAKVFIRQEKIGIVVALRRASKRRNVQVRILMPIGNYYKYALIFVIV